jgi:nucleotide-binding universal stress UspA family protein
MTAVAVGVLWVYRRALRPVATAEPDGVLVPAAPAGAGPMVIAVAGSTARQVSAMAVPLARARGAAVHVVNVIETDILAGEDTAELESPTQARALLDACVAELREADVPVTGELLHSYGTHIDVARQILRRAADLHAGVILLGPETRRVLAREVTAYVAAHAPSHVIILNPRAGALGRPVTGAALADEPAVLWDGRPAGSAPRAPA